MVWSARARGGLAVGLIGTIAACSSAGGGFAEAEDAAVADGAVGDGAVGIAPDGGLDGTGACQNPCTDGERRCQGAGVVTCAVDPATGCTRFGPLAPCPGGQTCSNGACSTECTDECLPAGTALCDGAAGVTRCGQYDTDACLDWSPTELCGAGQGCVNGACVAACTDGCSPDGQVACDGDGTHTCGNFDSDACLEWGPTSAGPAGQSCSTGAGSAQCTDECLPAGTTLCDGGDVTLCANVDSDPCLEWTVIQSCGSPDACVNGACQGCTDECPATGSVQCAAGGVQTCGQHDADACREWGAAVPCPDGKTCSAGACIDGCSATCEAGTSTCSGANGLSYCGADVTTGCPVASAFISCKPGNACASGACAGACVEKPELFLVVDRSSSMLGPVWDFVHQQLTDLVVGIQAHVTLGARAFPGDVDGCTPGAIVGLALNNAAGVQGALVEPAGSSSTPLAAALGGLGAAFGDPNQGEHVVLITDGSETCGTVTGLLDAVQLLRNRGTRVHVIAVGAGFDSVLLSQVATLGGGTYTEAADKTAFRSALRDVVALATGCGALPIGYRICAPGTTCEVVSCPGGTHACSAGCAPDTDPTACGATCAVCPGTAHGTAVCSAGACAIDCAPGYHLCGATCQPDDSTTHCGSQCAACSPVAGGTVACVDGACVPSCPSGQHLCAGTCYPNDSTTHCGAQCVTCPAITGGTNPCVAGQCAPSCPAGKVLLDGTCYAVGATTGLVINEVLAAPGLLEEFIEVVNLSDIAIKLDGLEVLTGAGPADLEVKATVAAGTVVGPKRAVIIFGGSSTGFDVPGAVIVFGEKSLSLNNGGDMIRLRTAAGSTLDELTYGSQTLGRSLTRTPDGTGDFAKHPIVGTADDFIDDASPGTCLDGTPFPDCL